MGQVPGMMGGNNNNNNNANMMGNNMQPQMNMMQNQGANSNQKDLNWLKENLTLFEGLDNLEKKNILGNLMYPLVEASVSNPDHVPKITGMLIDLEVLRASEIVEIMENQEALKE